MTIALQEIISVQGLAGGLNDSNPQVSALADGGFVVVWEGQTSDGQGGKDIFVQKFSGCGSATGNLQRLEGVVSWNLWDSNPQVAALDGGGFVVAWQGRTETLSSDIFLQRFDPDGERIGENIRLFGGEGDLWDHNARISETSDGGFVVIWEGRNSREQKTDIFVQQYDANGESSGWAINYSIDQNDAAAPSIVSGLEGSFVIVWQGKGSASDIFVQKSVPFYNSCDYNIQCGRIHLHGDQAKNNYAPTISPLADGGYVVVWVGETSDGQGTDIFAQRFDVSGFQSESVIRLQAEVGNLADINPTVSALPNGGFVVAWQGQTLANWQYRDIFIQTFNANGVKSGSPERLSGISEDVLDKSPQLASLSEGGFIVTWQSYNSEWIFVQRFDSEGNKSGSTP